ncbi:hypothetical protein CEXT_11881 [Caerostris extrusa]|uniref:Uncharacterized protein n=1 Tax=Caerostris extrusa TaxID=172846 RepID=A0AAV4UV73_CAEEX|nr:hypothetical protein CEXT_11881 [Caerostris extrusa]
MIFVGSVLPGLQLTAPWMPRAAFEVGGPIWKALTSVQGRYYALQANTPIITLLTPIPVFPLQESNRRILKPTAPKVLLKYHTTAVTPPNTSALGTLLWGILDELLHFSRLKA